MRVSLGRLEQTSLLTSCLFAFAAHLCQAFRPLTTSSTSLLASHHREANHHQQQQQQHESLSNRNRRGFLIDAVASATLLVGTPSVAHAAAPATPAEAIRRSAANIPGYGPTDVFFPNSWVGVWRVQRQVFFPGATTKSGGTVGDDTAPALVLDYNIRYLPSIEDNAVVADRGYNQANLEAAISARAAAAATATAASPPSFEWTFTNPNDLRLQWPDGRRKDIKVTQRATDFAQIGEGRLWSSEVQRVTNNAGGGGGSVPDVMARRVVTQYRWEAAAGIGIDNADEAPVPSLVQAVEVIYDLGGSTDPLKASGVSNNSILSKSRIIMQKQILQNK